MTTTIRLGFAIVLVITLPGCGSDSSNSDGGADLAHSSSIDFSAPPEDDLAMTCETPNACGDCDPGCGQFTLGPSVGSPFPISLDQPPDPNESEHFVLRDKMGYIDPIMPAYATVWSVNGNDWFHGTVSKISSKKKAEVARYYTVTCNSLGPGDRSAACDGKNGCCAADSFPQLMNRLANLPPGPAQQVQSTANGSLPIAVDWNGDVWVGNLDKQGSATKIANDPSECVDRNGNGKIDTSNDVNADGLIQTDCNGNGSPDNIADVKSKPCNNGKPQEFYGLDDECVLLTTNVDRSGYLGGQVLALGPGTGDTSDVWTVSYSSQIAFRIDGATGQTLEMHPLDNSLTPFGAAMDTYGVLWISNLQNSTLAWLDTATGKSGNANYYFHEPGTSITIDRDQNIWLASESGAYRYTPDRSMNNTVLDKGWITEVDNLSGIYQAFPITIAADDRGANGYFVWMLTGNTTMTRIPASQIPLPQVKGQDKIVDGSTYPTLTLPQGQMGLGVDSNQDLWALNETTQTVIRIPVDANGVASPPDMSAAKGNLLCPAGDTCLLKDNNASDPNPVAYGTFAGFGARLPPLGVSRYRYVVQNPCTGSDVPHWLRTVIDADQMPMMGAPSQVAARFRSGPTAVPDGSWGAWTAQLPSLQIDLVKGKVLAPNGDATSLDLQVEIDLGLAPQAPAPKLRGVTVTYRCAPPM
jgi:hypothetical protein